MPLEFTSAGKPVYLSNGTSVQLELNSPLFDEDTLKGTFSYSFPVPAAPNGPLYGFPERPDGAGRPGAQLPAELGLDGVPLLTGSQRLKSASSSKYSVSFQAGLSGANLSERLLSSFSYGGLRSCPRWLSLPMPGGPALQYPGLMQHANEVVASPDDYDYVFAPLRNEFLSELVKSQPGFDPKTLDPLNYPGETVNAWTVSPSPLFAAPAGGSFTYNVNFMVPGGVVYTAFRLLPPYCPWPKLRYVLQAICEESGLRVDSAQFLPGELGDLVLVSNAVLVDRGTATILRFSLADVVPELTVAELLAALRQDLGIVVYVEPTTNRVRTAYLAERVAPGAPALELSSCLAGPPEVSVDVPAGLTLATHVDGEDELSKDLRTRQPDESLVLPAVATVADLPATAVILTENPQTGQARLVEALDTWYACTIGFLDGISVQLTWAALVVNLPPVPVAGGGDEQEQATCYTLELPTRIGLDRSPGVPTALVPAISQEPYQADKPQSVRSTALRLLFYNGLQPDSGGKDTYPQLSHRSRSRAYSVRVHGPQGTYAQWLKEWLAVKLAAVSYKQPLLLTPLDLARLDLSQPLHLAGVPYLVRKLSAAVPLRKPATAELVRLF
jgi:hypothetical protein